MNKLMTVEEALNLVQDGMTFSFSGFVACALPEALLTGLEERFLKTGSPKNLFVFYAGSPGCGEERGANHLAHPGMIRKLHGGHMGLEKQLEPMVNRNEFPAYLVPQGVNVHLLRAIASGKPGVVTKVGLKTYCDPRLEGCRANESAKGGDVVELVMLDGREYLFYKGFPIDVCFLKGSTADEDGNISLEREGLFDEVFELAAATHNTGGKVVVQVERVVQRGTLNAKEIKIPGILVDGVVVGPPELSRQSYAKEEYDPSWSCEVKIPVKSGIEPLPLNERKICARRAAMEIQKYSFINFGIGVPQDIAAVLSEEGLADQVVASVESGVIGGVPSGGLGMGTADNPVAMLKHPEMFDLYDGGSLRATFLGAAEIDAAGNVNVTKFNGRMVGPGGFINISQNTPKVCFCGTFTAGGFRCEVKNGGLLILQDGKTVKFKNSVEQVSFSGEYALGASQEVLYITERAVFRLTKEGVTLVEVAPGVELQKDILDHMDFEPAIAKDLKMMDDRIFRPEPMGLSLLEL